MALPRNGSRSRFLFIFLALISVTLLTLDSRNFGPVERLKDAVAGATTPFRSAADWAFSPIGDRWQSFTDYDDLEAENAELRRQLDEQRGTQIRNENALLELEELKALLGLQGLGGIETVAAEVTSDSVSNFDTNVFQIDKGTRNGLANGMPVVTDGGLVGRIEDARSSSSTVRIITDPTFAVGIRVVGTEDVALAQGTGDGQPLRVESGIPVSAGVQVGDVAVTAGVTRGLYPENLAIGTITEVAVNSATNEYELLIEPSASTERLNFVTVLLYDPEAEDAGGLPDPEDATATADGTDGTDDADAETEGGS